MNGSISASVVAPPNPGSKPTQKPTPMPSSMKANAFHCRTSSSPWMNASITERARSFAEFYVLGELVDDVFRLRQHFLHHLERFVGRGVLEIELRLVRFRDQRRFLDRGGECFPVCLDDVGRRLRRQHVAPRHP